MISPPTNCSNYTRGFDNVSLTVDGQVPSPACSRFSASGSPAWQPRADAINSREPMIEALLE